MPEITNQGTTTQQEQPSRTNWTYRFEFRTADSETSDITVKFSRDGVEFHPYSPPCFTCFPSDSSPTYVVARDQDTVAVQLFGPPGWMLEPGSVQVIISRSRFALRGQRYSPLARLTYINPRGEMEGDLWTAERKTVEAGQVGKGASERYYMAVAFSVRLPNREIPINFSYDPEMDVIGS